MVEEVAEVRLAHEEAEAVGESTREAAAEPGLARSAGILGMGNIASRVLGLARDTIISGLFGSAGALSAFNLAARVPNLVYDLLVGGMLSAALVEAYGGRVAYLPYVPERSTTALIAQIKGMGS